MLGGADEFEERAKCLMYFRNQEAREHIIDTLKNQSNIKLKK
jgi:hypothetical protein